MINIDFLTLKAFYAENADFIINSRLQKIQQPTRRDFILTLRNCGKTRKLYININPQIYHIAFMAEKTEKNRNLVIPQKPPMFCMLLRKYLDGARICDAKAVERERILELFFEIYDELGEKKHLTLAVELMGKHSNIILYDTENKTIIGCAHNVGSEKSRYRELQGGLKYIYPPSAEFRLPDELEKQFEGLSKEKICEYMTTEVFRPAISDGRYTLFSELLENSVPQSDINTMLDNYYSEIQKSLILKSEKNKLTEIVQAKLKKIKNSVSKISALLKKRDNTERYRLYGDLLTANLYKKDYTPDSIEVLDYTNGKNITIPLDANKTLNENAQRYYKLYTKSKNTKEKSRQMVNTLEIERDNLENILYSINIANDFEDLDEIKSELNITEDKKISKKTGMPDILKLKISDFELYVGKNNKQNDYIVSKLAKDEDLWFHTKNCAGSHVLLKVNGIEPSDEIIYECCKLARQYSSALQPSKVGVIYTKAINLKKPPASPLGYVTYKNEKEILV